MAPRNTKETVLTRKHVARLARERQQSQWIRWGAIVIFAIVAVGVVAGLFMDGTISIGNFNVDYLLRNRPVARIEDQTATLQDFQLNVRLQRQGLLNQYFTYAQYAQFGLDMTQQLDQINSQISPDGALTLGQNVVDALVSDLLIRREAKAQGITVSAEEIDERVREIFAYYPQGTPTVTLTPTEIVFSTLSPKQLEIVSATPTPSLTPEGTLTETPVPTSTFTLTPDLTSTATPTPEQSPTPTQTLSPTPSMTPSATATLTFTPSATFTASATPTPYTREGFDQAFQESMDSYQTELNISPADYRKLVESDLLRQKVFEAITAHLKPFEEQVWARHILVADEATANTILERIENGEEWAALAAEFSTDTSNKDQGGDLGWFGRGQMVPEFEDAAFAVAPGQISKPVQSQFGWHLIQVIGHEERPITADAFEQKKQTYFTDWLASARREAEEAGLLEVFDIWMTHVPLHPDLQDFERQMQAQQEE
ncbi:MAG: Foldase protein PrsA [Anaerolineales bacterium]|nr:Foldase protein PrsA [Anaerolineales bacterium]